jgi:DnaJ-domain-containing protein 1
MQRECLSRALQQAHPGQQTRTHVSGDGALLFLSRSPQHACCAVGTLYEVLGISTRASAVEVKAAYRRKVLVHHPDVQQKVGCLPRGAASCHCTHKQLP